MMNRRQIGLLFAVVLSLMVTVIGGQQTLKIAFMSPEGDPEVPQYTGAVELAMQKHVGNFEALGYTINFTTYDEYDSIPSGLAVSQELMPHGIIGPAYSGSSSEVCLITGNFQIPNIAFYATSGDLSTPSKFPYFNRVMADDNQQVAAILLIAKKFGWERISCVHTAEDYGVGGANILVREANLQGITVNTIQSIDTVDGDVEPDVSEYDRLFDNLEAVKARVIVSYSLFPQDCLAMWKHGKERGFLGEGFVWIVTDGCAELTDGTDPDLKGVIALFPNYGLGSSTLTTLQNNITTSSTYNPDSAGYFKGSSFAYDATDSLFRALYNTVTSGGDINNGTLVRTAIRSLDYEGITGRVAFDPDTGDRLHGIWNILNLINSTKGSFDKIGEIDPNTGEITLNQDITFMGDTTNIPSAYQVVKYIVALNAVLGAVTGICVLFVIFIGLVIIFQWRKFRYSSPLFCMFILIGSLLGLSSVFTLLPQPTKNLCLSFPWLLGLGYVILFGTLFTKTWRTWRLFHNARKFKIIRISNKMMFVVVGSFVLIEAIFMIIWSVKGEAATTVLPIYKSGEAQLQCSVGSDAWWYVFVFYKVFYILVGVFLAFKTRDVVDSLNESQPISFSLYNLTFVMAIAIPLGFLLTDYPTALLVIEIVAIILSFTTTVALLFLPKVWKIISGEAVSMDSPSSGDSSARGHTDKGSFYSTSNYNNEMKPVSNSNSGSNNNSLGRTGGSQVANEINTSTNSAGGMFYTGGQSLPKSSGSTLNLVQSNSSNIDQSSISVSNEKPHHDHDEEN